MWKVGTKVNLKIDHNSWSRRTDTLIVRKIDNRFIYCSRQGSTDEVYPYSPENLEKLSWNPLVRIKRMFCRAFELPYK